MSLGTSVNYEPGSWGELGFDIFSGLTVGAYHSIRLVSNFIVDVILQPLLLLKILKKHDIKPNFTAKKEKPSLKVVGAGYGRTGTYSLTLALEELGFPTLHTQHMYDNYEILDMWTNNVFVPSIQSNSVTMGKPDFDLIAEHGFTATMDLPTALYVEEIEQHYPDCKFILTTRSSSEVWFRSWDVLTRSISQPARFGTWFPSVRKIGFYMRWLFAVVNKDDSYLSVPFPLPNQIKRDSIASYEEHNHKVRTVIPPHKLLEYDVKDGWEPLCKFLEIENCPTKPFPKSNSARSVQIQAVFSIIFPLSITLFIIFFMFSFVFQKSMGTTILNWFGNFSKRLVLSFLDWSTSEKKKRNNSNEMNTMKQQCAKLSSKASSHKKLG